MATRTMLAIEQRRDEGVQLSLFGDAVGLPGAPYLAAKVERIHTLARLAGRVDHSTRSAARRRHPASRQERRVA